MTQREIDLLITKIDAGNASKEDQILFEEILEAQASDMGDLYTSFTANEKAQESSEDVNELVDMTSSGIDNALTEQKANMGELYNEYVAYAQNQSSVLDVNLVVQMESGELDEALANHGLGAVYEAFIENERNVQSILDVDLLIQSQTGSLDSLLEQQEEGLVGSYGDFVQQEKQLKSKTDVSSLIQDRIENNEKNDEESDNDGAKIIPFRKFIRRATAVAAIGLVVIAAVFMLNPTENNGLASGDGLSDMERIEAEKALDYTLAALGVTTKKLDKGRENMKALQNLKHTRIFK